VTNPPEDLIKRMLVVGGLRKA